MYLSKSAYVREPGLGAVIWEARARGGWGAGKRG